LSRKNTPYFALLKILLIKNSSVKFDEIFFEKNIKKKQYIKIIIEIHILYCKKY
jgi:hypothetical protein